jgi:hypothetical protein
MSVTVEGEEIPDDEFEEWEEGQLGDIETIDTDDIARITREVAFGLPPAVKDTPYAAEFRRRLAKEMAEIEKGGGVVEVPSS